MLRLFALPVACSCVSLGVVAQSLKPVKRLAACKRTQQLPTLLAQQCWELLRPLDVALERCTGIAEVKVRNLACLYFFKPFFRNCMSCVFNCDDLLCIYFIIIRAKTVNKFITKSRENNGTCNHCIEIDLQ